MELLSLVSNSDGCEALLYNDDDDDGDGANDGMSRNAASRVQLLCHAHPRDEHPAATAAISPLAGISHG